MAPSRRLPSLEDTAAPRWVPPPSPQPVLPAGASCSRGTHAESVDAPAVAIRSGDAPYNAL
eukprot:scaffold8813_cov96-Isochrysis_galbana.AAC.4